MSKLLVIYDTYDGQTEKIARAMVEAARCLGFEASAENVEFMSGHLATSSCDAIIIGGPIHTGSHSRTLRDFIKTNETQMRMIPSAFFSVSLSAAGTDDQRDDAQRCMDKFLESVNFEPLERAILAGALKYQKYGFFKRFLMKRIVGMAGGDTDTTQDYEYTSWPEVTQFVGRFLEKAGFEAFADDELVEVSTERS